MKTKASESAPHTAELYPIRTVAKLTGVNAVTLRAWERRYGLIVPQRTEKGHRLYTRDNIKTIRRVLTLLESGISIGQIAPLLREQAGDEATGLSARDPLLDMQTTMLNAIIDFDEQALNDTYDEALSLYPVGMVTSRLIVPLLRQIGERWEQGKSGVAEEHFFSTYMRNKLGARLHHRGRAAHGPKLLMACLPHEYHETGILLFSLAAIEHGFRVLILGANMPFGELPEVVARAGCEAVVLAGYTLRENAHSQQALASVVAEAGVPVFVGGRAAQLCGDTITGAGATALSDDALGALLQIRKQISSGRLGAVPS